MTKRAPPKYKMSFAVGGLHPNESVEVARLHRSDEPWDKTLQHALNEGIASLPKAASRRRTLREIVNRISTLGPEEINFLIEEADRSEQQALLWVATCRAYRFVREFATEVLRERYLSYQLDLPLESFDILLDAKAEWDEDLSGISASTRAKLRQVLFRMMREAQIISEDHRILSAYVSPRLKRLLEDNCPQDLLLFPGVDVPGSIA
jgi:hypothetical protein